MSRSQRLKVGEEVDLELGDLFTGPCVIYAGMPNPEVFSIAINKRSRSTDSHWGYNLYFPKSQIEIHLKIGRLHIQQVTPEEILLQYYTK